MIASTPDASRRARVDVVMTCYNEVAYIGPAVRSVLGQTRADCIASVVIADDGSSAPTIDVLRKIETWDPRIRVIYGPGGAGVAAQRNRAIASVSAPFIALLDGDDLWAPDKLGKVVDKLTGDEGVGAVYTGYWSFATGQVESARRSPVRDITRCPDLARAYFMGDPPIIPSTTLIRRSAFESCGRFDADIRVFEDSDFFLRLARVCRFAFLAEPLVYKRTHTKSITGGRADLMAHHAFVAFKAATRDPGLLPLVPLRLSERARKLGNLRFILGDPVQARQLLTLAVRLNVWNLRAWVSLTVACLSVAPLYRMITPMLRARRAAMDGQ